MLYAFCVGMCVATACRAQNSPTPHGVDARDLDVYTAVLDSMFTPRAESRYTQIAVDASTEVLPPENAAGIIDILIKAPHVDSSLAREVVARSDRPHSLRGIADGRLRMPVLLADSASLAALPRGDIRKFWSDFYTHFPHTNGLIQLSSIGYSPDRSLGALMVDVACGGLCGNGYIVVVKRDKGRWHIANIVNTWIS